MALERLDDDLAPSAVFYGRLLRSLFLALILIAGSLAGGMWGYHHYENMSWIDAFLNASMILAGMGPVGQLNTDAGKLFAGAYAIYSGLFLIGMATLILTPVVHRFLHRLHVSDEDEN